MGGFTGLGGRRFSTISSTEGQFAMVLGSHSITQAVF